MFLLTSPTSTAESRLSLEKSPHRNLDWWFFQSTVLLDGVRDILPGITPTNISNPFLSREGRHPQDTPRSWEQSGLSRSYFAVSYRLSFNFNSINDRWGMMPENKTFGSLLKSELRDTDVVARTGGEEFALLIRTDSYSVTIIKAKMIC